MSPDPRNLPGPWRSQNCRINNRNYADRPLTFNEPLYTRQLGAASLTDTQPDTEDTVTNPAGELIMYRADNGRSRAVQIRQWAITVLSEYLVKGFALQDERLKDAAAADYFDGLLARIRDIRASEKRFYWRSREPVARPVPFDAAGKGAI